MPLPLFVFYEPRRVSQSENRQALNLLLFERGNPPRWLNVGAPSVRAALPASCHASPASAEILASSFPTLPAHERPISVTWAIVLFRIN